MDTNLMTVTRGMMNAYLNSREADIDSMDAVATSADDKITFQMQRYIDGPRPTSGRAPVPLGCITYTVTVTAEYTPFNTDE
jgi:hypothetical protein